LNISLERAVDYLKIKGLLLNQTQKFLMMYTMSCAVNLGDRGKRGFKRSREEKRKEKRLYVLREVEEKRKHGRSSKQQQEVVKRELL
jgi:translation initiation factor IF-2